MTRILHALFKRLLGMVVVLAILVTLVFVIVRVTPGDPAAVMLGADASPEDVAQLRERMGLNIPLIQQYFLFVGNIFRGDLGESIFLGMPVTSALAARVEPTFFLALFSIIIATGLALPVGIISAYKRGSWLDHVVVGISMIATSIPSFWLGLILIQMFAVQLGWFPSSGYGGPGSTLPERLSYLVLPSFALGIVNSALIMRFTRAAMLDVLGDDYVRTARAKGVSEHMVVLKHALRNALIPVITVIGLSIALLISGAVVTETVFGLPGVGNLVVSAVMRRDYPVIQGALLTVAAVYVLVNFVVDMLYVVADPRIRL